jgi:hypothetical protein
MDIVQELDRAGEGGSNPLFIRAADSIVLEREIANKLYRALTEVVDAVGVMYKVTPIVEEALDSYYLARLPNNE